MNVINTNLPGVLILQPKVFEDNRGFFKEKLPLRALPRNWNSFTICSG